MAQLETLVHIATPRDQRFLLLSATCADMSDQGELCQCKDDMMGCSRHWSYQRDQSVVPRSSSTAQVRQGRSGPAAARHAGYPSHLAGGAPPVGALEGAHDHLRVVQQAHRFLGQQRHAMFRVDD